MSSGERGVERDRGGGERLAHRAVRLGRLGGRDEVLRRHARHRAPHREVDARDPLARLERDVRGGVERVGRRAGAGQAWDRAIEKQAEWAAAISSSGLVRPSASLARDAQVTSKVPCPDDCSVTWPAPSMREPSQCVVAFRVVAMSRVSCSTIGCGQRPYCHPSGSSPDPLPIGRFAAMQDFLDAIEGGASGEDIAALPIPESYRAAHVLRSEQDMWEGVESADKDPRKSLHVGDVPTPELAPDEVYLGVMASLDQLQHGLDVDLRAAVDLRLPRPPRQGVGVGQAPRPGLPRGRLRRLRAWCCGSARRCATGSRATA